MRSLPAAQPKMLPSPASWPRPRRSSRERTAYASSLIWPANAARTGKMTSERASMASALTHDRRHLVHAVMEGIAYSLRHLLDIYVQLDVPVRELVLSGGGTQTPGLCQIIADVCGLDAAIYCEEETVTRVLYALYRAGLYGRIWPPPWTTRFPNRGLSDAIQRTPRPTPGATRATGVLPTMRSPNPCRPPIRDGKGINAP